MNFRRGVIVLMVLAGSAAVGQTGAHAASVTQLKAAVEAVSTHANAASAHAAAHEFAALKADCRALRDDAGRVVAFSRPKLVSRTSWRQLMGAISKYYNAVALCIGATKGRATPSVSLLRAASDALDDAHAEMALAAAGL